MSEHETYSDDRIVYCPWCGEPRDNLFEEGCPSEDDVKDCYRCGGDIKIISVDWTVDVTADRGEGEPDMCQCGHPGGPIGGGEDEKPHGPGNPCRFGKRSGVGLGLPNRERCGCVNNVVVDWNAIREARA